MGYAPVLEVDPIVEGVARPRTGVEEMDRREEEAKRELIGRRLRIIVGILAILLHPALRPGQMLVVQKSGS